MSQSVNLPALGESVTEGTVTRWLKNVGDHVEVDEPLVEVSTDKVDTEIPSPIAGVIEAILVQEDETVEVGTPLVTVGDGSGGGDSVAPDSATTDTAVAEAPAVQSPTEAAPAVETPAEEAPAAEAPVEAASPEAASAEATMAEQVEAPAAEAPAPAYLPSVAPPVTVTLAEQAPAVQTPADAAAPVAEAADTANAGYVTPLVRKLANEKGIDLSSISGTGVGGRIRKQDLLDSGSKASSLGAVSPGKAAQAEVSPLRGTTVPMSRLRRVIAERAVASMQASAQLTTVVEVDVTKIAAYRDSVKAEFNAKTGVKLSFLPFFALATAEALKSFPIVNATIDGDTIVYPPQENISIAVDTERGLLTPVVRDAGSLNLAGLAGEIADLATRTRDNQLKPDELAGGTFTLTNTGSRGALFDTPVVFMPQSAILGTGIVNKRPVVVSHEGTDSIAIRSMVYLALSYDHRIIDGADASRFLVQMKNRLEAGDFSGDLGV